MTNEQRKAIDRLKQLKDYSTTYYGSMYFKVEVKADDEMKETIDTVLSLIKEQQEEIGSLQKELNEENKRSMILANNDKFKEQVIDLMVEYISKQDIEEDICMKNKTNPDWCNEDYSNCKDCIKQYYEREVEDVES